jgi:hypothetical protein
VEVDEVIDLADDVKRVIVFDEDDQREQREDPGSFDFGLFVRNVLNEGWDLVDVIAGKDFIMKFEHKKKGGEQKNGR